MRCVQVYDIQRNKQQQQQNEKKVKTCGKPEYIRLLSCLTHVLKPIKVYSQFCWFICWMSWNSFRWNERRTASATTTNHRRGRAGGVGAGGRWSRAPLNLNNYWILKRKISWNHLWLSSLIYYCNCCWYRSEIRDSTLNWLVQTRNKEKNAFFYTGHTRIHLWPNWFKFYGKFHFGLFLFNRIIHVRCVSTADCPLSSPLPTQQYAIPMRSSEQCCRCGLVSITRFHSLCWIDFRSNTLDAKPPESDINARDHRCHYIHISYRHKWLVLRSFHAVICGGKRSKCWLLLPLQWFETVDLILLRHNSLPVQWT